MSTGLVRWVRPLPVAAIALFACSALARPLLLPAIDLEVPPLPSAPSDPEVTTQYGLVAIDEGTLLVTASRPTGVIDEWENAVHYFERDGGGNWNYAGIFSAENALDIAIDGDLAAVSLSLRPWGTSSEVHVFERGPSGWAMTGSIEGPYARLLRIEDGSIFMRPEVSTGCQPPYEEYRRVNGVWVVVATIGGQRCDFFHEDFNDGMAVILHRPRLGNSWQPAEIFASSQPAWTLTGSFPAPAQTLSYGYGATIRGDTINVDVGFLRRNVGGSWASAGRLFQPEGEAGIGGVQGKLRGNHLVLFGQERDYDWTVDDYENFFYWNVLRVYRQNAAGGFVYHARLNSEFGVYKWSLSDDGRYVAASGIHVNDQRFAETRRLYVFEIPETTTFPGTRQDTFSNGTYSRWTVTAGQFSVTQSGVSRALRQTSLEGDSAAFFNDANWADQGVEADVRLLEYGDTDSWFGLVTRRSDAQNYYYLSFRAPNQISLRRVSGGVETPLVTSTLNLVPDKTYRVRLESVGDQHVFFLNGIQRFRVRDATLTEGHPGVAGHATRYEVDNVVMSPGTRILLRFDDAYGGGWYSDNWGLATGYWEKHGDHYGAYLMQLDDEADARWFSVAPAGYQVVSTRVRPQSQGSGYDPWFGLAVRVIDDSNYYYLTLRRSNTLSLRRLVNGQIQVLGTVPHPLTLGAWHDLRLEVIGTHIRAYANGELKIEYNDSALGNMGAGRNGLLLYKTAADVENYIAYQP